MITLFDAISMLVLAITLFPFLAARVLLLSVLNRMKPVQKRREQGGILRIVQGDFETIQKKGVLFIQMEDKEIFEHVYVVTFPAERNAVIEYEPKCTFIEIGKIALLLKGIGFKLSYACINLFWFLLSITRLNGLVRRKVSLIRGSDPHHSGFSAMLLSFMTRVPYFISIQSDYDLIFPEDGVFYMQDLPSTAKLFRKAAERFILSNTKFVFCRSASIKDYALRSGARREAVKIIFHGIDVSLFDAEGDSSIRKKLGCDKKDLIVIVSRVSREKNVFDVPDIVSKLSQLGLDFMIIVAGDGPDRPELDKKIRALNLEEKIKILGFQDSNTVVSLRKAADVNLCLFDGYSLIEAALSGKPVVAYDTDWHAELVRNGVTGILVADRDTDGAALAIKHLLDNPETARELGQEAKKLAARNHSLNAITKKKQEFYEQVLSGSSA